MTTNIITIFLVQLNIKKIIFYLILLFGIIIIIITATT
jgi:hypothetical protein